jgi:subtilisin family serine protease
MTDIDQFTGWAIWSGTSFSTPKVSAAIARLVAQSDGALLPLEAYGLLVSGGGGVTVTPVTDVTLSPFPGVTLPHLHLG